MAAVQLHTLPEGSGLQSNWVGLAVADTGVKCCTTLQSYSILMLRTNCGNSFFFSVSVATVEPISCAFLCNARLCYA